MYWHPAYVAALTRRIAAEARWLITSPHGHLYTYVWQTWAAIGEEGLGIPTGRGEAVRALRDGSSPSWVVPSGCAPMIACDPPPSYVPAPRGSSDKLASPTDRAYMTAIANAWIHAFNRSIQTEWRGVLLLRANGYDDLFANITTEMMNEAGFGWFQTGAAMTESSQWPQPMLRHGGGSGHRCGRAGVATGRMARIDIGGFRSFEPFLRFGKCLT